MKRFSTLKELYNFCKTCPTCQTDNSVNIVVGPKECFLLKNNKFSITNDSFELNCLVLLKNKEYDLDFIIHNDSSFEYKLSKPKYSKANVSQASSAVFFFYFENICPKCKYYSKSSEIELNILDKELKYLFIEREKLFYYENDMMHHIMKSYASKSIAMVSYKIKDNEIIEGPHIYSHDFIDLNFSDPEKAYNKIKTIMIFE